MQAKNAGEECKPSLVKASHITWHGPGSAPVPSRLPRQSRLRPDIPYNGGIQAHSGVAQAPQAHASSSSAPGDEVQLCDWCVCTRRSVQSIGMGSCVLKCARMCPMQIMPPNKQRARSDCNRLAWLLVALAVVLAFIALAAYLQASSLAALASAGQPPQEPCHYRAARQLRRELLNRFRRHRWLGLVSCCCRKVRARRTLARAFQLLAALQSFMQPSWATCLPPCMPCRSIMNASSASAR